MVIFVPCFDPAYLPAVPSPFMLMPYMPYKVNAKNGQRFRRGHTLMAREGFKPSAGKSIPVIGN